MKSRILLTILLISALVTAPVLAQSERFYIETVPLSEEMRKLPVKVYWRNSTACPAEFNALLKKTLDTAIILLRKSIWRFMEENDGNYDEMVEFRIVYVDSPEEAQIILTGDQLEDGTAGVAALTITDEGVIPPTEIVYDCEVVLKPVVPAFNVVLHELLHGLGLGHANFPGVGDQLEIMGGPKPDPEPTIYVSTLDLHALYLLWFEDYREDKVALDIPFKEVRPYVVEFEELRKAYRELHEKYGVLEEDVAELKTNLKLIEKNIEIVRTRVKSVETRVSDLSENVDKVTSNLSEHEERLSLLEIDVGANKKSLGNLAEMVSEQGDVLILLQREVRGLRDELSTLKYLTFLTGMCLIILLGVSVYLYVKLRRVER